MALMRRYPLALSLLLLPLLLAACMTRAAGPVPVSPLGAGLPEGTDDMPWWNDTVYYEVFVRSFYDSDGDGIGDLAGLTEKLDYLNDGDPETTTDLGVTGIWLMPIMEATSYHGYDVIDYYAVEQDYGTAEDFKRLVEEAHARGIRVIVDLVLNHTGREHPWFQEAIDPAGERHDWYIWADTPPDYRGPWGQVVWHPTHEKYYYGVFWDGMPDLNFTNPEVTAQMHDAARFWLEEMGADGFRLDAIKHLVEDGQIQENTAATHAWLQEFYRMYKEVDPQAFVVGEAWTVTDEVLDYIGDEVDIAFEFDLALAILNGVEDGRKDGILRAYEQVTADYPAGQYGVFLTNHDQNRVFSEMNNNEGRARMAASVLLTSPGVPFIYYGEEIGMRGIKPDEDIRRPMQWSAEENAGFSTGRPWRAPHRTYAEFNVAAQDGDPDSLLNHYRALVQLRNNHEALRVGEWTAVETSEHAVYAFLRHSDEETLLVVLNLEDDPLDDYTLSLAAGPLPANAQVFSLYGEGELSSPTVNDAGGFDSYRPLATLPPFSTFVIQIQPGR